MNTSNFHYRLSTCKPIFAATMAAVKSLLDNLMLMKHGLLASVLMSIFSLPSVAFGSPPKGREVCCDNIPHYGRTLRDSLLQLCSPEEGPPPSAALQRTINEEVRDFIQELRRADPGGEKDCGRSTIVAALDEESGGLTSRDMTGNSHGCVHPSYGLPRLVERYRDFSVDHSDVCQIKDSDFPAVQDPYWFPGGCPACRACSCPPPPPPPPSPESPPSPEMSAWEKFRFILKKRLWDGRFPLGRKVRNVLENLDKLSRLKGPVDKETELRIAELEEGIRDSCNSIRDRLRNINSVQPRRLGKLNFSDEDISQITNACLNKPDEFKAEARVR